MVESLACSLECGRLEEQTVTIRDMNREIVDMRSVTVNCYTSRYTKENHKCGVIGSMLASSVVDCGFKLNQVKPKTKK